MTRQQRQHVIKESHSGLNCGLSRSVECHFECHIGLGLLALHVGGKLHASKSLKAAINPSTSASVPTVMRRPSSSSDPPSPAFGNRIYRTRILRCLSFS